MASLPPLRGSLSARSPRSHSQSDYSRPSSSCSTHSSMSHKPVTRSHERFFYPSPRRPNGMRPDSGLVLPTLRSGSGSVLSKYARYHTSTRMTLQRTSSEECLKCMLKVPHSKCEAHKYIRVGGGYRHSYWYIRTMMEDLEQQLWEEQLLRQRLEAINETSVKAVKTYIRTKSGRLIERIVFLTEEDYQAFQAGGDAAANILKRYLTNDEAKNLDSWDKDEVKAIKTFVRTKSGKLVEKLVYISKDDYDKIKGGEMSAGDVMKVLKKYVKTENGERIDGWGEAQMKQVKTYVRTKSGRLVEKIIMVSQEDYDKLTKEGGDPAKILGKYLSTNEGETIESWKKADKPAMKVIKTYIRTKSGKLVEKTILMTEDEYKKFQESGGDITTLKRYLKLGDGETIEDWEKASTVYGASSDEETAGAEAGTRIIGKDGAIYEVLVDPITGKKYKKRVANHESDVDSGVGSMTKGRLTGKSRGGMIDGISEEEMIQREKRARKKQGKRGDGSDSEYSYKSDVSVGGTRRVTRRQKNADGTRGEVEVYNSDDDVEGAARRRRRRRERAHGGSANSYYSVESAGGTRHVRRKKKRADGTYEESESYHSSDSEYFVTGKGKGKKGKGKGGKGGGKVGKKEKKYRKVRHEHGSDSEYSYASEVSEGGTKHRKRKKRLRDADGNVIGYEESEAYTSPSEYTTETNSDDSTSSYESVSDGKGGRIKKKKEKSDRKGKKKKGKRGGAGGNESSVGFSDATTDSDVDLENMTEEEKKQYFEEKAKRKAAREKKRREKYGDQYDEMMEKHEKKKQEKREQKFKSMVSYEKGASRGLGPGGKTDGREPGLAPEEWGKKGKKGKKYKDGNEADSESEDMYDYDVDGDDKGSSYEETIYDDDGKPIGKVRRKLRNGGKVTGGDSDDYDSTEEIGPDGKKRKKGKKAVIIGSDGEEYEVETDAKGNIIKKKKKKKNADDSSASEYEYEYDKEGNLIGQKKIKKKNKKGEVLESDSDGDYFEKDADGKIRLKAGKKKIDISKLTDDDLRALGIDPTLSKQEIARQLQERFGDDIKITKGREKVGLKNLCDYGSDADTDDLANDSDLDTSTLTGKRRVQVLMRRGGQKLIDHMKKIVEDSNLNDEKQGDEKDSSIDFLTHYRLVDPRKLEGYARSFAVEDDDYDAVIAYRDMRVGMSGIPSLGDVADKQMDYVCKVLRVDKNTKVSFRMFAVISSLAERVTKMDSHCQEMLKVCNLMDIERKLDLYRAMFYWNTSSDRDPNFIKSEALKIELIAGGLSWPQQDYIMEQLQPNEFYEISFLDYICYIPLFLSFHDNICDNPLDMSNNKYTPVTRRPGSAKRDMNPLGNHLKKNSPFNMRAKANELIDGKKPDIEAVKEEHLGLLEQSHNSKLPDIIDTKFSKKPKK